jgi:putative membrane protein
MLWAKSAHVISVIAWMAALLYLPRLLVYHADSAPGSEKSETFKVMERRLLRGIAMPAMIASWAFGLWMAWLIGAWTQGWFWGKLACVVGLTAYQLLLAKWVRNFAEDRNARPARFYRFMNEVPTLFMIAIVVLVTVQPRL